MLPLIPLLWRRLEFASVACIGFSFWALAVLVHIRLQGGVIEPLVLGVMLLCCLLLLGFVSLRRWKSLGTPGLLLLASIASYLFISSGASLAADSKLLLTEDVARQGFFFVVTLAAIVGGRWMLERIGAETVLKWTLVILAASCAIVLASPLLRDIGVLPEYRLPFRLTGAFTDPNDAGFIACMTVALALAFQSNGRQRLLGYLALVLGCAAGILSFSNTAAIVLGVMLASFLLLNVRRLRQDLLHTGLTILLLAGVLVWITVYFQGIVLFGQPRTPTTLGALPETFPKELQRVLPDTSAVKPGYAGIREEDEAKRVGTLITAYLVYDWRHWADDDPVNPWRWRRADASAGGDNVPDDATWTDVAGDGSCSYTPTDSDRGKFLHSYVYYEKEGEIYWAQTVDVGPVMAASEANAPRLEQVRWDMSSIRGETCSYRVGGLARRVYLWELGAEKALASPIVGHGLYQLHYMEGALIGNEGIPTGVHNVYLMLIGEAGIIPLALYLLSLFFLMRLLWTVPKSLGRDLVVGWVIVMALFGLAFHHLLTMGAYNFLIGLACATAAFLVQGQRPNCGVTEGGGKNQKAV